MNKRLERVENAKEWLKVVDKRLHDARFDSGDMALFLDNGYIFYVQGFTTKESFDKAINNEKEKVNE